MDITNKAVKVCRRMVEIEDALSCGDLMAHDADQLRIEYEELSEWNELLDAYFGCRNKLGDRIAELERENAELMAQVEVLRIAALNAVQSMSGGEAKADLRDVYDATPAQCLNQIKAEAVQEFANYACNSCAPEFECWLSDKADKYAASIAKGE
jgi:hypothetical protein